MPPKGARASAKRKAPAKTTVGGAGVPPQGKILAYFGGGAQAPGSKRRRGEGKQGANTQAAGGGEAELVVIEDSQDALPRCASTADEPVVIEDSQDGAAVQLASVGPSSASAKEAQLARVVPSSASAKEAPVRSTVRQLLAPADKDSGIAAGAPGRSATHSKAAGTLGNFGALVTHPGAACKLERGWWGRSFSLAYRNLFSDRRPAGVGCHGANWGRRVDLQLAGFRCAVLGGGKAANVLTIPTAGPYRTPAVDARHWRNLRFMLNALSPPAGEEGGQEAGPFDQSDRRVFQMIRALPACAQELFASLRHAAYGACGGLPAGACRWFICQEKWAQDAACALCDAGLARRLRTASDAESPVSLLPLLSDAQLRHLVDNRLGGNSKACRDRDALVSTILAAANRAPTAGQQCIKFQRVAGSAPAAGAHSTSSPRKKAISSPGKGSSVQTVLNTGGPQASLPRAVLELLAAGPLTRDLGANKRSSSTGRSGQGQAAQNSAMERVVCIKLTDEAEASCHRLQLIFFVLARFSPDEAAALLLCDLERLALGLGWEKSAPPSSAAAAADVSEDEYDAPAPAGALASEDDGAPDTVDVTGGHGAVSPSDKAHADRGGAATPRPVASLGWAWTKLPTREEARNLEESVACSDSLELAGVCPAMHEERAFPCATRGPCSVRVPVCADASMRARFREGRLCHGAPWCAVRCGDHEQAYDLLAKATASLILQDTDEPVDGQMSKDQVGRAQRGHGGDDQAARGPGNEAQALHLPCFWSRVVVCGIGTQH